MPGPAIYVVAAISTVAAVVVFKHFVYDPHLRPTIDAWAELLAERRRERQRTRHAVAVPAHARSRSHASSDDDNVPLDVVRSRHLRRQQSMSSHATDSPIELEDLVQHEVEEWRTGVSTGQNRQNRSGLRSRHPRRTSSDSPNLMDEHAPTVISVQPLAPTRPAPSADIIFDYPGSPADRLSPAPSSTSTIRSVSEVSSGDPFQDPHPLPALHIPGPSRLSPGLPTPVSLPAMHTHPSSPDTHLMAASMLSTATSATYLTPQGGPAPLPRSGASTPDTLGSFSPTLSSPRISLDGLSSPPMSSRAMSPFDVVAQPSSVRTETDAFFSARASATSPFSDVAPLSIGFQSPRTLLNGLDDADVFALRSESGSSEDFEELASVQGSDVSSWADAHEEARR